jgi:DNA-binding MltR family transcriptional regulator
MKREIKRNRDPQNPTDMLSGSEKLIKPILGVAIQKPATRIEQEDEVFRQAFKEAGLGDFAPPKDVIQLRNLLGKESDRGCALVAAAFLEDRLEVLLQCFLVENKTVLNRLFGTYGPLGTFSAKIDVAFSVGLINHQAHVDLDTIRKIRNEFAHHSSDLTFSDKQISGKCKQMILDVPSEYISGKLPPKRKFMRVCIAVAAMIDCGMLKPRIKAEPDFDLASIRNLGSSTEKQLVGALNKIAKNRKSIKKKA